ncbi:MAG: methyltransferase domain-containing protein [Actinobacteria bacterium]|nr:methyltransferase domain-containing protein [Actinomycetota bacterium]
MLTVNFDRLGLRPGDRVLDLGCGAGRHAFEIYRRGGHVVALDMDDTELKDVRNTFAAMFEAGETNESASATAVRGDGLSLPFPDATFDRIVASEVLEHISDDEAAMRELARVLKPGGAIAVTVPRFFPELVCWALDSNYHETPGGHVRIYRRSELVERLRRSDLVPFGAHHAHGLHSPYWWLKCAVGVGNDEFLPVRLYHRLLVWDIVKRPLPTRVAEAALTPFIGKSLVVYLTRPAQLLGAEARA